MIQNLITDLVCIDCGANLMRNLADNSLFDTAQGISGTSCDGNDFEAHHTERVSTHLIAWFTVGSASAPVTRCSGIQPNPTPRIMARSFV